MKFEPLNREAVDDDHHATPYLRLWADLAHDPLPDALECGVAAPCEAC